MTDACILISDADIKTPEDLLPIVTLAISTGKRGLLIIAHSISETATAFLLDPRTKARIQVVATKLAVDGEQDNELTQLYDLAMLTGGRPILTAAGASLLDLEVDDLGLARRVWIERSQFGLSGGKGNARQLRQHIRGLQEAAANCDDNIRQQNLRRRVGKFMGGTATLWIGGATQTEIDYRKGVSERTASLLRGAIQHGVVPGGGIALLNCRAVLRDRLKRVSNTDERAACRILLQAVEAPFRQLICNAGLEPSSVLAQLEGAGTCAGYDLRTNRVVDLTQAGVWDTTHTVATAVEVAINSAAMALTVDVVVYHKSPEQVAQP
jgi:chaperonin GroEL